MFPKLTDTLSVSPPVEGLSMPYDVDAIRKRLKQSMSGKFNDPDEFRPEKAKSEIEATKYAFFILPPVCVGDAIKGGTAKRGMENQFFCAHGTHWVQDKPYPCPRIWDGSKCKMCEFGFELLKDENIKSNDNKRTAVVKQWMPTQYYMMNIFFPHLKTNPEDLRGRVMFYNAPKTIVDICSACLMRDDAGDPESPEAFGVFFDENAGFVFELQVTKHGRNNSYKTSKFRPALQPMARNPDGSPNPKMISDILASRHDLFSKMEAPNAEKLDKIYKLLSEGDDSGNDRQGGGFDSDEVKPNTPAGKVDPGKGAGATTVTSKSTAKAKATPPDDDDVVTTMTKPPVEDDEVVPVAKSQAAPPKAAPKPQKAPVSDDASPLAAEAPLPEAPPKAKAAPPTVETKGNTEAINNLLSQLDDDDS